MVLEFGFEFGGAGSSDWAILKTVSTGLLTVSPTSRRRGLSACQAFCRERHLHMVTPWWLYFVCALFFEFDPAGN